MAKQIACGTIINWDDTPPADLNSASWKAVGAQQSATPPDETWEEVDVSELAQCKAEAEAGREALSEFSFVHYEDQGDTATQELESAWAAKTKAAWQIVYPHGSPTNPTKEFFGYILSMVPSAIDQTTAIMTTVTVRRTSDINRGALGP